jgi:XRE family aerobic/anaerobic benzoate catabolism transcriptional regulator
MTSDETLLRELGERVRSERRRLGLTVRELAASSALSERFLVSLEGGKANVSVVRLSHVAAALGTGAAALLGEVSAPGDARAHGPAMHGKVALIGLRGAGKSSVGRQAAERLGVPFIELDQRVTARAGLALGEIFDLHGPAFYRKLEREELERCLAEDGPAVIAVGGGMVTDHAAFERLLASTCVLWLKATPEDHFTRVVAQGDLRPMADRKDAMKELRAILRARRALYERAHHVIDTSALGLPRSIDRVVKVAREARSDR